MHGAISALRYVFMALCLIQHREKFTFSFSTPAHSVVVWKTKVKYSKKVGKSKLSH
jgi:hypothetical protein